MKKRYILFAGANGVGKTTLFHSNTFARELPGINLDDMVREIGDWRDPQAVSLAGKRAVKMIREYLSSGRSFWQETTLCGKTILRNIQTAYKDGYDITVYYIGVESADVLIQRIKHRVSEGGHGIPDEDVRRRFTESLRNMRNIAPICNKVYYYDNTDALTLIGISKEGSLILHRTDSPKWFQRVIS